MSEGGDHFRAASAGLDALLADVAARAMEADKTGLYPRGLVQRAAELGLFAAAVRIEDGGSGWDELSIGLLHEAAGRACTAFRSLLTVQGIVCRTLQRWGSADQRRRWLPRLASGEICGAFYATEERAGSDLAAVEATATSVDGGYVINGRKCWVTFGADAGFYLVLVKIDGKPAVVLIEAAGSGIQVTRTEGLLGLRGAEVATVVFEDVFVPADALIGPPGSGLFAVVATALDFGRFSVAWGALGLAASCLHEMLDFASVRRTFGKRILDHQLVRAHITETAAELRVLQTFCKAVAVGRSTDAAHIVADTSLAKFKASRLAMNAAWRAAQVLGARGVSAPSPVERMFRDAKVLEIIEGSHEVHQVMLAEFAYQVVKAK